MLRRSLIFASTILSLCALLWLVLLRPALPAQAATSAQSEASPAAATQTFSQPVRVTIRQQLPLTISLLSTMAITTSESPTEAVSQLVTQSLPVTLDLAIDAVVSDTQIVTTPVAVKLRISAKPGQGLPSSLAISVIEQALAELQLELVAPPQAAVSEAVTTALDVTTSQELTPSTTPVINARTTVSANVRSGPSLDAARVSELAPESGLAVEAQSADQNWLLLNSGYWVSVLVVDAVPAGLPVATDELVNSLRASGAPITATVTATATPSLTETAPITTETPSAAAPDLVSALVNANLRAGPGVEFDLAGSLTAGQAITISGRNADASWYRLDIGSWLRSDLVANAPLSTTIPLVNEGAIALPTPTRRAGVGLPTATPRPTQPPSATPTPTVAVIETQTVTERQTITSTTPLTTTALTVEENLYLRDTQDLLARYDGVFSEIERLSQAALSNQESFDDAQWKLDMETAIVLLRRIGEQARALQAPARFTGVNDLLLAAVTNYDAAATYYEDALQNANAGPFDQGLAEAQQGDAKVADFQKEAQSLQQ
jgi:uncharacterized protein YraI